MFRILIIDDDPTTRLVLTRALQNQNYEVAIATNGEEGIIKAQELKPALIICDWMMPLMDGLEVCRQIKAEPELSTTFFILLTARGDVEDRVKGLETGADEFLSKPIEMVELRARVQAGLRLYQLNQDLQIQKQLLEAELAEAAEYVRSILPAPLSQPVQISACFIPSCQLGGDCFDYYWLDSNCLVIYLLDVSGHGLGAALPSVSVLNLLRSQSFPGVSYYQPQEVLTALNETFQMSNQNEKYFTIWYGVYNQVTRQLVYASAGHPPAILISGTSTFTPEIKKLKTPGLPIGMFPESKFIDANCDIEKDSILYVFSDGIYEINQSEGNLWGLDAFIHLLSHPGEQNIFDLDDLLNYVLSLSTADALEDDLSLLEIKFG
jgi:sigma-B regulation protein RsbU (phosphoserine phosphatase)